MQILIFGFVFFVILVWIMMQIAGV